MRLVRWLSGAVWIGSWYLMYLEITRWHHVKPSLAFNAGPPIPGTDIRAKPGKPLKLLYVACATAPPLFVAASVAHTRGRAGARR
ncbi:MAG TPA: hypothetical protein VL652_37885 [Kutzneria sp.]|nr:hypothetical protein [Kutzneria sp.]